jgi:hypothetical protein
MEENLAAQVIDIPVTYKGSSDCLSLCWQSSQSNSMRRRRLREPQGFHLKLSNRPDIVAMSTCPTMTASQFMCKFLRSSSRWRCTSSCARRPVSWPAPCFTTVSQRSALVPDLISFMILRAAACSCLKEQRDRTIYGTISVQKRRCVPMSAFFSAQFNLVLPIFSLSVSSCSISPYPRITVHFQPARLRCLLVPRMSL